MRASWITLPIALLFVAGPVVGIVGQAGCQQVNDSYIPSGRFAAEYAQALCTSLQPCCEQNAIGQSYSACTQGWQRAVETLLTEAGGDYNISAATKCIQQVRAAVGGCNSGPGTLSDARTTCQQVFAGQLPLGAPCTSASQCAQIDGSVVTCAISPNVSDAGIGQLPLSAGGVSIEGLNAGPLDTPVCVIVTPIDAAEPSCVINKDAGTDSCTAQGGYCDTFANVCAPLQGAGLPCDQFVSASCAAGNYCPRSGAQAGVCQPANTVGQGCQNPAMCVAGTVCDIGATNTCIAVKSPNAPCVADYQCSIGICDSKAKTCLTNAVGTTVACNGITTP
jgi:hypothetical protein